MAGKTFNFHILKNKKLQDPRMIPRIHFTVEGIVSTSARNVYETDPKRI
jgi:hypothetical protein